MEAQDFVSNNRWRGKPDCWLFSRIGLILEVLYYVFGLRSHRFVTFPPVDPGYINAPEAVWVCSADAWRAQTKQPNKH